MGHTGEILGPSAPMSEAPPPPPQDTDLTLREAPEEVKRRQQLAAGKDVRPVPTQGGR